MKCALLYCIACFVVALLNSSVFGEEALRFELRYQTESSAGSGRFQHQVRIESWQPEETAIIVCDVWDLHHCLNAVRRLEQFVPRLNDVLKEARRRGVMIIHSPSDCMPAYADHAARRRAIDTPRAKRVPFDCESWCSLIPAEERAVYPIDQSDGGEDDDPQEHAEWVEKLKALGRNPGTPWAKQSDLIAIDADRDYISDRGDEVWNILEHRQIENVILTGVHTNMCVLGRPFGLRQMVRNGKNVVLMRDMTDTMYNPQRWPYVSHFRGSELIVSHIERFVCPTVTSDQVIGGEPFRFASDQASATATKEASGAGQPTSIFDYQRHWTTIAVPAAWESASAGVLKDYDGIGWYRCVVRIPSDWLDSGELRLVLDRGDDAVQAWCNGEALSAGDSSSAATVHFHLKKEQVIPNDANLLVVRVNDRGGDGGLKHAPVLESAVGNLSLNGRWQFRLGDDPALAGMPLPAKFGASTDMVFLPPDPLWTARPLTRRGEFTSGIEGPACDSAGNVLAVNFARQGTIGRVRPDGTGEVFVELPAGSVGNGIRFDREGFMYVADYPQHNVLRIDPRTREITTFAHNDDMHQPNDLAIAADGTLYASDPNWSQQSGQLWRIDRDGKTTRLAADMGTTNGIEVSPDGRTLYVNESVQRNVWAFTITDQRTLTNKRLLRKFEDHGFDGMRCDVDGNLYITRYGKGTVVKLSPAGEILREIDILGGRPSNICFGGPDGRTAYVPEVEHTRLVSFRVDRPGLAWQRWQSRE